MAGFVGVFFVYISCDSISFGPRQQLQLKFLFFTGCAIIRFGRDFVLGHCWFHWRILFFQVHAQPFVKLLGCNVATWYAQSHLFWLIFSWANQYIEASLVAAYTALQPVMTGAATYLALVTLMVNHATVPCYLLKFLAVLRFSGNSTRFRNEGKPAAPNTWTGRTGYNPNRSWFVLQPGEIDARVWDFHNYWIVVGLGMVAYSDYHTSRKKKVKNVCFSKCSCPKIHAKHRCRRRKSKAPRISRVYPKTKTCVLVSMTSMFRIANPVLHDQDVQKPLVDRDRP